MHQIQEVRKTEWTVICASYGARIIYLQSFLFQVISKKITFKIVSGVEQRLHWVRKEKRTASSTVKGKSSLIVETLFWKLYFCEVIYEMDDCFTGKKTGNKCQLKWYCWK